MAARPFESKIQNLVYNMDVGIGLRLIKFGLYLLFIFVVMLLYTATQFHGLKNEEAMDCAQVARNLTVRHSFSTQCLRPATIWYLQKNRKNAMLAEHPDILHAPVWPAFLAVAFKLGKTPFIPPTTPRIFPPEQWVIIPACHFFTLMTGLVIFFLSRRLFDRRLAFLAVTMYVLSNSAWAASITGTSLPLVTFLATTAFYTALVAVTNRQDGLSPVRWFTPLALSLVLCVLAALTRYAAAVLAPAISLYVGISFRRRRGWAWALGFLVAFLIGVSPWLLRNTVVSGGPFGLAPYTALNNSRSFEGNAFERTLSPSVSFGKSFGDLQAKSVKEFGKLYDSNLRALGDGLFICLFLTAFFYRFVRAPVHLLRWCAALAIGLLLLLASLFGESTASLLHMFWPLVMIYGFAFFFILLDRLQLSVRLLNYAVTGLFMLFGALPLIVTMMPPRTGTPYPPYFPPFIGHVCKMMTPEEIICTDMPWATAWYGNRTSLLLPATIDEFYEINDYAKRISGIYFTTITRDKPFVRGLLTGADRTWFPLLEGRIPPDFPLTQGFPINNMDQLFLTDRMRWNE